MSASEAPNSKLTTTLGYVSWKSTQKAGSSYPAQSNTVNEPSTSSGGTCSWGGAWGAAPAQAAASKVNPVRMIEARGRVHMMTSPLACRRAELRRKGGAD